AANENGVRPIASSVFAIVFVSSILTMASCPLSAAHDSGVLPYLSFESISMPSVATSILTTALCPLPAAHDSGVRPSSSLD
ncbi:hypothetical protein IWW34DRAFT_576889, partial [Fusarium oxysporum f. sp. albedinis]